MTQGNVTISEQLFILDIYSIYLIYKLINQKNAGMETFYLREHSCHGATKVNVISSNTSNKEIT